MILLANGSLVANGMTHIAAISNIAIKRIWRRGFREVTVERKPNNNPIRAVRTVVNSKVRYPNAVAGKLKTF
ncbi:MAG: hypothetical protein Kow00121_23630 [Elainellaceae cyanobacterium]